MADHQAGRGPRPGSIRVGEWHGWAKGGGNAPQETRRGMGSGLSQDPAATLRIEGGETDNRQGAEHRRAR